MSAKPAPRVVPPKPAVSRRMPGFLQRARNMLLQPRREWQAINGEFTNIVAIYRDYIVPLAAIGPIAYVLGVLVFGQQGTLFGVLETSLSSAVQDAIAHYILGLLAPLVVALALEYLAPVFGGQSNRVQGLKVAAYATTPAWLFAMLGLVPRLAPFALIGLVWTLFLIASGAPLLMKVAKDGPDQAPIFRVVAVVLGAVAALMVEVLARVFV